MLFTSSNSTTELPKHCYQKITLPDGRVTDGRVDHSGDTKILGLDGFVKGSRFLDIASNDGFWAFWAEQQGAKDVLGIDVEKYEAYDWGLGGVPPEYQGKTVKNENFLTLKKILNSKVRREALSVYDLNPRVHGLFDIVFCYGLIYHLRHPLMAFDKMRSVTNGMCVTKTHTLMVDHDIPYNLFFLDDVFDKAVTNWTGATEACIVHWMKDAGFQNIFVQKVEAPMQKRALFSIIYVGTTDDKYTELMRQNTNFVEMDEAYFYHCRRKIRQIIYPYA